MYVRSIEKKTQTKKNQTRMTYIKIAIVALVLFPIAPLHSGDTNSASYALTTTDLKTGDPLARTEWTVTGDTTRITAIRVTDQSKKAHFTERAISIVLSRTLNLHITSGATLLVEWEVPREVHLGASTHEDNKELHRSAVKQWANKNKCHATITLEEQPIYGETYWKGTLFRVSITPHTASQSSAAKQSRTDE